MGPYAPLVPVILMLLAYLLRRYSPAGWMHTPLGATLIALLSGVLSTVASVIADKGLHASAIVPAVCTFVMSFIATANPSLAKGDEESPKLRTLLPLVFLPLLMSGCGTAGGKAFTACELGKLPAIGQTAFATAHDIADNQSSTAADLTTAALELAPGQFECAAKALLAWLEGLAEPIVGDGAPVQRALLAASTSSFHDHAKQVLREYLKGKATSCAPMKLALEDGAFRPIILDDEVPDSVR